MDAFTSHLTVIERHQAEDLAWIKNQLTNLASITQEHNNTLIDLDTERNAKRDLHKEKEEWKAKFESLQSLVNLNAFILVLIDGDNDGYMFKDEYLLRGVEGGRQAAHDLTAAIKDFARVKLSLASDLPCFIKVYANIDKVGRTMQNHGMHETAAKLRDFYRGFCQMGGLIDVVDVGDGADQADHQIKGLLNHFKTNPCCTQIVLGSCHDNGYVSQLNALAPDEVVRRKIVLLQSFRTGRQYGDLPYQIATFPGLFREQAFGRAVQTARLAESGSLTSGLPTLHGHPNNSYASMANRAVHSAAGPIVTGREPVPDTSSATRVWVNNQGQRVDQPLTKPPQAAWTRFDEKKRLWRAQGKRGACNQHLFFRNCSKGLEACDYSHASLSAEELSLQRYLVRGQPCSDASECRNTDCPYGHHCMCTSSVCNFRNSFRDLHGVTWEGVHAVTGSSGL